MLAVQPRCLCCAQKELRTCTRRKHLSQAVDGLAYWLADAWELESLRHMVEGAGYVRIALTISPWTCVGHTQNARACVLQFEVLIREHWPVYGLPSCPIACCEVPVTGKARCRARERVQHPRSMVDTKSHTADSHSPSHRLCTAIRGRR